MALFDWWSSLLPKVFQRKKIGAIQKLRYTGRGRGIARVWHVNTPYTISYRCSTVTESLSPAVFKIMGPKHISRSRDVIVMWRFDSVISYWRSIAAEPLSPNVFQIFVSKAHVQCKSSLCLRDITLPAPRIENLGTHFSLSPHISYSLWHFCWAPMKNKACLVFTLFHA